jgi:hypothetical protein
MQKLLLTSAFKNDIFQVTSTAIIATSALLHLTRHTGHYAWQQVIWDGYNTLQNSVF